MALITSTITYYRSTYYTIEVEVTPPDQLTATTALFTVKSEKFDDDSTDTTALVKKTIALTGNKGTIAIDEGDIATLGYSTARKLSQKLDAEKWRRLQQDSQRDSEAADEERKLFWKDVLRNQDQEQQVTSECGLSNGYGDEEFIDGNDYFPSGATSSVTKSVGPSGARHGDNPEQKLAQIAETYEQLISAYRQHIRG